MSTDAGRRRVVELPALLANQIAAGEVVARPSSVVKELMENALDAAARTIRVEIDGGGIQRIRVIDDGHGMDEQDARLALRRHATSKLRAVEDLASIGTYGFRGEALPSIASVSKLTMRTRLHNADAGLELHSEGGAEPSVAPWGGAPGTSVEVAELFYNVPARRKFVRAVATESANVGEVVRAVALVQHQVHVELARDGRQARRWLRVASREERVRSVLNEYELIACIGERGPVNIEAYLSHPERARTGAGGLSIFVCGRPVQDRALSRAAATAYGELLAGGRYPVGAIFIELPLELVDVNVHPQKAEVRFAHARAVTAALHDVVRDELPRTHVSIASPASAPSPRPPVPIEEETWTWSGSSQPRSKQPPVTPRALGRRYIGRAGEQFLLFEDGDSVVFIDAQRAHTLLLLEQTKREWASGRLSSQRLLFPVSVQVSATTGERIEQATSLLSRLGFDVRRTGPTSLAVHGVPRVMAGVDPEALLAAPLSAVANNALEDDVASVLGEMASVAAKTLGFDDAEPIGRSIFDESVVERIALADLRRGRS
jgi:DNA mismatch repair protein MutL